MNTITLTPANENSYCANCLDPHTADNKKCYARPKIMDNKIEKFSKLKHQIAQRQGIWDYASAKQNRAEGPPKADNITN